jgi:hypothetical protein
MMRTWCGAAPPTSPPPSPSPPPLPPGYVCLNSCIGMPTYATDGFCDDGGPGAEYLYCQYGTDCADCGLRQLRSPSPPRGPPPPSPPSPPPSPPTFSYAYNGESSSYTGGCQSTWIRSDNPNYVGANDTGLFWDGSSSVGHFDSALVQFPDIIGSGPYQLRPHEQIQRATLRYYVDLVFSAIATGATAQLHEISKEWNATSTTFRTFAGAQGLNEAEYRTPAIATALANRAGWFDLDVTASVRSWVNGVGNNGWIWMPSPQNLGGSGDGSQMRACSAPPDRRVNLVVLVAQQPPRPPSPPAPPPPPPPSPSPPPSPPRAPFTVMTIRNAEHAWLRMIAADINYATSAEVFWDGNSACVATGARTNPSLYSHVVG